MRRSPRKKAKPLRVGLSMRVTCAHSYDEIRDALAVDWTAFMTWALPEVAWVPVPNLGVQVEDFVTSFQLDAFVLTGGNDLDAYPQRDTTEAALLSLALRDHLPLLGVCRGLQLVARHVGLSLEPCPQGEHVGTTHEVCTRGALRHVAHGETRMQVNSFHNFGVPTVSSHPDVEMMATCGTWIEAMRLPASAVAAVMWHPERPSPSRELDRALFRQVMLQEAP